MPVDPEGLIDPEASSEDRSPDVRCPASRPAEMGACWRASVKSLVLVAGIPLVLGPWAGISPSSWRRWRPAELMVIVVVEGSLDPPVNVLVAVDGKGATAPALLAVDGDDDDGLDGSSSPSFSLNPRLRSSSLAEPGEVCRRSSNIRKPAKSQSAAERASVAHHSSTHNSRISPL